MLRILFLEASAEEVALARARLQEASIPAHLTWASAPDAFVRALRDAWSFDLLLADDALGGREALETARARAAGLPFILLSDEPGGEAAAACLRLGAADCLPKAGLLRLAPAVRRVLEEARREAALREAEAARDRASALLRATLESTREGLLVLDLAGRISACNQKFLSLCGIPEYVLSSLELDEVIQYLARQVGTPEALLEASRLLRCRSDAESAGVLALPGGRTLEAHSRPHLAGREVAGRVLSLREPAVRAPGASAPGRSEAAEALKTIGAGRQSFVEAALAARVVPWYLAQDRLVFPAGAEAVLGRGAMPGDLKELEDLLHPEDAEQLREALERSRNFSFLARIRGPGGAWRRMRLWVDRGPEGHRGVLMDVTEQEWQREREGVRQRTQGAKDMARRAAGRVLDDLRTARADLGALGAGPGHDRHLEAAQERLGRAEAALARMKALAHLGKPALRLVQPNEFAAAVLAQARREAEPEIRIDFVPGEGLPALKLDPAQMDLALSALVHNAREALGGAGAIQVATGLLQPRPYRPGGRPGPMRVRVTFEVRDAGPGISPALSGKVFEPFFTTRLDGRHAGLGLTLAREVAEAHGGSVTLESMPGGGTVVRVALPV